MVQWVQAVTDPGAVVLVASRGDDDLVGFEGRAGRHFPQAPDGEWAGYHPADSDAAIRHLEALRDRGAGYFVLPSSAFWWLHYYDEFAAHLDHEYRRIYADEHLIAFDLRPAVARASASLAGPDGERPAVLVLGTYRRTAPAHRPAWWPSSIGASASQSRSSGRRARRLKLPSPPEAEAEAEWTITIDNRAVLPSGFLDTFLTAAADGQRRRPPSPPIWPAPRPHPPLTERLGGVPRPGAVGEWSPLPVRAVSSGRRDPTVRSRAGRHGADRARPAHHGAGCVPP